MSDEKIAHIKAEANDVSRFASKEIDRLMRERFEIMEKLAEVNYNLKKYMEIKKKADALYAKTI
jgi:hypothetical protein